ncbi:MAG: hypothetical protein ACOYMA_05490 [Bacteroidia bacterium]
MIKYSRFIHVLVLCTFFLPFFRSGCNTPSAEEKLNAEQQHQADSIAICTRNADSIAGISDIILPDSFSNDSTTESITEIDTMDFRAPFKTKQDSIKNDKEKSISQQIVEAFPIFRILLNPEPNIYTGIGTTINVFPYFFLFGTFLSLLVLLVSFLVKFIERKAQKTILLLEILAFIFLYNASSYDYWGEELWGYWVSFAAIILLTLFDFYIWWKSRKA